MDFFRVEKGKEAAEKWARNGGWKSFSDFEEDAFLPMVNIEDYYWVVNDEAQQVLMPDVPEIMQLPVGWANGRIGGGTFWNGQSVPIYFIGSETYISEQDMIDYLF